MSLRDYLNHSRREFLNCQLSIVNCQLRLVVEQPHPGEGHGDAVFVALFDDQIVPDGAARLGDVLHAGGHGPLNVVGEGEEGIGA